MAFFLCDKLMSPFFSCVVLCCLGVLFSCSNVSKADQTVVPAMYVFGDSLVDVGNNNYLPLSVIKADFPYNGIDFPGHKPTGRFSNGKNAADIIAEKLGVTTPPPYLSKPNNVFLKGVSFASGGAGIFNTTGESLIKHTIPLAHQVGHFSTVRQILVKAMGSSNAKNSPQQHVTLMVSTLKELLKGIYGLGGRKFLVIGVAPIGCAPKQRYKNTTNECNNEVNYWSKKYNDELTHMLPALKSELKDFHYTYFDVYRVFVNFIESPAAYGFSETKAACCGLGRLRAKIPCTPLSQYCSNRSAHLFWDIYHPTEAAARIFIDMLFGGSADYVSPITLKQLIAI
ncbi:hypothetical protein ACP275_13G098800 [Erythranthe tilingii]